MSVYRRGNVWWCNVMVNNKRIQCSTGQTEESKAKDWERKKIASLRGEENAHLVLEKVKTMLVDNKATFNQAWGYFEKYPRAKVSDDQTITNKSVWQDFAAFCMAQNIDSVFLVTHDIAAQYVTQIKSKGRFASIVYTRGKKTIENTNTKPFSARTTNFYIGVLRLIFHVLQIGKFVLENPFENIQKFAADTVDREIFTESDIQILLKQTSHPLYPIIMVGLFTGLRKENIVALQYKNIDLKNRWIKCVQFKTGNDVEIPITEPLYRYFSSLVWGDGNAYMFPELHQMYVSDDAKLSKEFKKLLSQIGISDATIKAEGRSRASSVKDIHSFRHTFAYLAGKYQIPLAIVQSVLGHMTPAMTRHYMAHATMADKQHFMAALPDPLAIPTAAESPADLLGLVKSMTIENWQTIKAQIIERLEKPTLA